MKLPPIIHATVDFETRCHLPIKVGAWKYSRHWSCEVMCFSWKYKGEKTVHLWHPAYPHLDIEEEGAEELAELLSLVRSGRVVMEAHNAFFEQCVWRNVCTPQLGWPEAPIRMWRCSMAKASTHGMPRALEDVCRVMGVKEQKDTARGKASKKLWSPNPRTGKWIESRELFEELWLYNMQDVRAEESMSEQLADLPPFEQELWFMDQAVNFRGVLVDRALCEKALALVEELKARNNVRFREITGLSSASQRKAFTAWAAENGLILPDTKGENIERLLIAHEEASKLDEPWESEDLLPEHVAEALRIVYENNRTSTRKYATALSVMDDDDDRIRGSILFAGAERTWRWAGRLIQPHNYPRGVIADMDSAVNFILECDLDTIIEGMNLYSRKDVKTGELIGFKDVMEFLSHALRGMIKAEQGRILAVSDFAAIEARVLFWLADEQIALIILKNGQCIYCDLATDIYGYPCNKKEHPDERQLGKQGILGLGFGMGDAKFVATCFKYNIIISDKLAQKSVKAYRNKYKKVGDFWSMQEDAAIYAMLLRGLQPNNPLVKIPDDYEVNGALTVDEDGWVIAGKIAWRREGKFLKCQLPSGRCNIYPFPELVEGKSYFFKGETMQADKKERVVRWLTVTNTDVANKGQWTSAKVQREAAKKAKKSGLWMIPGQEFHGKVKYSLKYKGKDSDKTGKEKLWTDIHTYSGKITENIVQGTARDLMAAAMLRCHEEGKYDVTLSVHDELVTEIDEWLVDLEEFNAMMMVPPEWAEGCPIGAEGWSGMRYRK